MGIGAGCRVDHLLRLVIRIDEIGELKRGLFRVPARSLVPALTRYASS
jgi:hypothetical protein